MFRSVLVVCVGNICRSPLGERALRRALPDLRIDSAGIAAVVGHEADRSATEAAAEVGVDLGGHVARQLTGPLGAGYDLILVMEPGHRSEISKRWPQLSGRVMLFDQWSGGRGIEDPYRRSGEVHRVVRDKILTAAEAWVARLKA